MRYAFAASPGKILQAFLLVLLSSTFLSADDNIPRAAWRIPIGQPPANPGGRKPELSPAGNIDDGYWQGAPVGGFGAGTFSRSYRGHYERWHVKAGVHKYEDVPANQFAVFVRPEGGAAVAQVLATGKPQGGQLSAWNWNYPAGAGEYAAVYPKSWFAYQSRRTVLARAPRQLQRDQLSGRHLQLVCPELRQSAGYGLAPILLDEHGGMVPRFHAWLSRRPEQPEQEFVPHRTGSKWDDARHRF